MAPAGPEMAPLMTCWLQLEDALHCAAPCKIMGISWNIFYLSILLCISYGNNGNILVFVMGIGIMGISQYFVMILMYLGHQSEKKQQFPAILMRC